VPRGDLITIYTALIRSILEYACPVWHSSLPQYLIEVIERIQKRAFRIISPNMSYRSAMKTLTLTTLNDNRQRLCVELFTKIKNDSASRLQPFLTCTRANAHGRNLCTGKNLTLFKCNTERFKRSFFPAFTTTYNAIHS